MADVDIRQARPGEFEAAMSLLSGSGLPVDDLREEQMRDFFVATSGTLLVGLAGLEPCSGAGLLRSLVVAPGHRSAGIGRMLVSQVEAHARRRGISELWLLTTDAERYFRALGYAVKERDTAPPAIRRTAEFSLLCPGSATPMQKTI